MGRDPEVGQEGRLGLGLGVRVGVGVGGQSEPQFLSWHACGDFLSMLCALHERSMHECQCAAAGACALPPAVLPFVATPAPKEHTLKSHKQADQHTAPPTSTFFGIHRRYHIPGSGTTSPWPSGLRLIAIAASSISFSISFRYEAPFYVCLIFLRKWVGVGVVAAGAAAVLLQCLHLLVNACTACPHHHMLLLPFALPDKARPLHIHSSNSSALSRLPPRPSRQSPPKDTYQVPHVLFLPPLGCQRRHSRPCPPPPPFPACSLVAERHALLPLPANGLHP